MVFKKNLGIFQIYSFITAMDREMGMREKSTMELQVEHWCGEQLGTNSCCRTEVGN